MTLREFFRYHLLKVLLVLVVIQLGIVAFVQNFNHRPLAAKDQAMVFSRHQVSVSPLKNDSDKDDEDEISLSQVQDPIHGKAERKGNSVQYKPNDDYTGLDSLAYTITDGDKESKPAYIVFDVKENKKPLANEDVVTLYSGMAIELNLLDNDLDNEGDSIGLHEYSQPASGKVINKEGNLYYVAGASFSGIDSFRYSLSDGKNISDWATVRVKVKSKTDPCYPWMSTDVGNVNLKGGTGCNSGKLEVTASGSDIWNNRDGFHFAYQDITGNCEMVAKVEVLEANHEWAKAGLMIRESLSGGSKDAFVCITGGNGAVYHQRRNTDESKEGGNSIPELKAPYWLKIKRSGNTFFYFISENGRNWKEIGSAEVVMPDDVLIGFALTSHNNDEIAKAVFSRFKITGK